MSDLANVTKSPQVIGIGEALFDCFGDRRILGGAPINFAVHAHQLLAKVQGQGLPVSCIGSDALGERLVEELLQKGMQADFIQQQSTFPTGTVEVELDSKGQPTYTIHQNVAWDQLAFNAELELLAQRCDAVCFGTLAQRSPTSRQTIHQFLSSANKALKVFDLNLRQDYFDATILEQSLRTANVVKLNAEELEVTFDLLNLTDDAPADGNERAFFLCRTFDLKALALTRGKLGTLLFSAQQRYEGVAPSLAQAANADSVGAGDACCAAITCGLLLGLPLERVVTLANQVGAYVASQPGATPVLPTELVELFVREG